MTIHERTTYEALLFKENEYFTPFEINQLKFALFTTDIERKSVTIDLKEYNVIVLNPIRSKENLVINATNLFALDQLISEKGGCKIHARGKVYTIGAMIIGTGNVLSGDYGVKILPSINGAREQIKEEFLEGLRTESPQKIVEALFTLMTVSLDPYHEGLEDLTERLEALDIIQGDHEGNDTDDNQ